MVRFSQRTLNLWICSHGVKGFNPTTIRKIDGAALFSTARDLPDYGKTPVEVDKIRLSKIQTFRRRDLDGQTLIDQTLKDLENDENFQETAKRLKTMGQQRMSLEERKQRRRALDSLGIPPFKDFVQSRAKLEDSVNVETALDRSVTHTLQLNIGLYCNQACGHCHVESSPKRKEMMTAETAARCLDLLKNSPQIRTLDITGGAPELNDQFRFIISTARAIRGDDLDIIDRCNLTVLHEPGQENLVDFLQENKVHVIASLPCYSAKNVDTQRGKGVFERSISALLMLNEAGYGSHQDLVLDLVYNPLGAFLPPPQANLEQQYKAQMLDNYGVLFNNLYTMTNMPVKRFADFLHRRGELEAYMNLLVQNFNFDTVSNLMCKNHISIGYDGKIYDCDFNQQLGMVVGTNKLHEGGKTVFDIQALKDLQLDKVRTDNHCFGCTAGMGSS